METLNTNSPLNTHKNRGGGGGNNLSLIRKNRHCEAL